MSPPDSEAGAPARTPAEFAAAQATHSTPTVQPTATYEPARATGPYASTGRDYLRAGWPGVLPVEGKHLPPEGFTGAKGHDTSYADVETWASDPATARLNVALRLPRGVVGLDVDAYDGRHGGRTLAAAEERWGALPETVRSTSRADGVSGIRLFRVPGAESLAWHANLDPFGLVPYDASHIDVIRHGHRYAMVWPSVHPKTGQVYRWLDADGQPLDGLPRPDDLPELPAAWVAGITGGQLAGEPEPRGLLAVGDDHTGPIRAGGRDEALFRNACSLVARGIPLDLALRLQERRWQDCEQPPGDVLLLSVALAKVPAAYDRYPAGVLLDGAGQPVAGPDGAEAAPGLTPLDWTDVLEGEQPEPDWLAEPVVERGTSVVVYSPPKAGKSLLLLDVCARLAAGLPVLGHPAREPLRVLYLDAENTRADLAERLRAMHVKAADLGARLVYLQFPALQPLDTAAGGAQVQALAREHRPDLVVLDTLARFVQGDENEAQTYADLYRHALLALKRLGIAVVRLDHAGKDVQKGQRGSSAKSADVDAVWRLAAGPGGTVDLVRDVSRNGHGAERVRLARLTDPLRHVPADGAHHRGGLLSVGDDIEPRLRAVVKALDDAEVPVGYGRDKARALLSVPVGHALLNAAQEARRHRDRAPFGDDDEAER